KVIIEAEFFSNGTRQMEFNADSLKWDHKGTDDAEEKEQVSNHPNNIVKSNLISINSTELETTESADKNTGTVTLHCTYTNTGSKEKSVKLKAYFMDANGKVLSEKSVSLSCSGNATFSTDISASGMGSDYKSYK